MTRLICVRHGQTTWNKIQRVQGQQNSPLDETGRLQAQLVGERLKSEAEIAAVYASDLQRAYHTAEAIVAHHPHLTIQADQRLREIHLGRWETRLWSEIQATDQALVKRWQEDVSQIIPPGGESIKAMAARISAFLDEMVLNHNDDTVLLVAHGGTIRCILTIVLECPLKMVWRFGTDNTSITELTVGEDGPFLSRLNDTFHLMNLQD
ncbi:MAG: histidine phosphatase family protein [Ardenticatenaceae bacterium]|nr:histidine phosphatase family protein [Ardenticatenaceae bacterium]